MKKGFFILGNFSIFRNFSICWIFGNFGDFLVSTVEAQTCEVSPFRWNEKRVEIVENPKLGRCASLKADAEPVKSVTAENLTPENPADVEFTVTVAAGNAGIHRMNSLVAVCEAGREKVSAATTKYDGLAALVQVNDGYVTSRFIVSPPCSDFSRTEKFLGLFNLPEGESVIRFWLPKEVEMAKISVWKFGGPKVPEGAEDYVPRLVPDCEHPRILMNREKLPEIRRRLTVGENAVMWEYLQEQADQPWIKETALRTQREWECNLKPTHLKNEAKKAEETGIPSTSRMALGFNSGFMRQAQQKAFTALMRNDVELARDTAEHFIAHVRKIEFGNVLDITREVGQTIYTGAMVYDWLYEWLTEEEKAFLAARLMELAVHLECSYPPFGRTIFNGHGNESMILRDTLALGIAIYERNPEPYRYCAWLIMDQLVPVRELQYRSPRHNQGFSYAFARVAWEYQAAALFYGFSNDMVFAPNILSLRDFIVHMRLPSGETILDGDGTFNAFPATMVAESAFIISALGRDSLMKGEALRSFGFPNDRLNPILFLILNDPTLEPTFTFQDVPCAIDTGEILPSHILRTGWGK
ncbi:MAG: hypothetical protein Q4C70_14425, partial [Planctomycetia bacterium]|nr:hypothetical protein [Planctomycetia bacterium]